MRATAGWWKSQPVGSLNRSGSVGAAFVEPAAGGVAVGFGLGLGVALLTSFRIG